MKKVDPQVNFPKLEEEVLAYWEQEKIFEQTLAKDAPQGDFVFYEGPPTANGRPGLHHVLARAFKDAIPRFKTMQGYRVERKAGWDTHGLPVELQVEKALGLRNKHDIENIVPGDPRASIIRFNEECRKSVWEYKDLWEQMTRRMGYWVDMEHPYITYDNSYIESVWWQLKAIAEAGYLYRGHKVVPYCYRCGTALSSHEVAQGYQTVTDNSAYVKFRVRPGQAVDGQALPEETVLLAWTTTPWTLPGNVALAVNGGVRYALVQAANGFYILAANLVGKTFTAESVLVKHEWIGSALSGLAYEPLYRTSEQEAYTVVAGEFVTTDTGTGIVHIAPAFGEDDAQVGKENNLPTLITVNADGSLATGLGLPGEGMPVKKKNAENRYAVDDLIIADLTKRGLFFREEAYEHEYPFCWRCDTPLIYYAKPSWFIRMSGLREELAGNGKNIRWVPEHIKEGRFGEWLSGAKDWAISRERYWGTPLPIWNCNACDEQRIVSSRAELKALSGAEPEDVHRPYIDEVSWKCDCGGEMLRTSEVLDVWFDSGAMPLAQSGYQGEGELPAFPADYISEAIDQTRGWFYTLHAIATLLQKAGKLPEGFAYRNVICLGHVMDAQGKKMSKSKGNIIEPFEVFDAYGADALRWFFFSANQPGLPKRFDPKAMRDVQNRLFRMLWNSYSFFTTYATIDGWEPKGQATKPEALLDRWILSEYHQLATTMTAQLECYEIYPATQAVEQFMDDLSNWYIRRSRKRFWKPARHASEGGSEDDKDKEEAYHTLYTVLEGLARLLAPFTPFVAEEMYRNLSGQASVHLAAWPDAEKKLIDPELSREMQSARAVVAEGLKLRAEAKIKVRQPLAAVAGPALQPALQEMVREELNVKAYAVHAEAGVVLDTALTPELILEGKAREIIRAIQEGRKKAGFNVEDRILVAYEGCEAVMEAWDAEIATEVLAVSVELGELIEKEYVGTASIDGEPFLFTLARQK